MKHHKHRPPREVLIDGFDARGGGQGLDANGTRWSIRGAPAGALILAVGRNYDGTRLALVKPSEDAVPPPCGVFGVCGGCQWQEMPAQRQRDEKGRMLARLLGELGGEDHGVVSAGEPYGYRNKIELTFGTARYLLAHELNTEIKRVGRWLGFHAPGRFDRIVDTPDCALASPAINAVYARVRADVYASDLEFWDCNEHTGFLRNLILREGLDHDVLVALYTAPGTEEQAAWLREHAPGWGATCVGWFENQTSGDAATGDLREVLVESGRGLSIAASLGGIRFQLSPTAFFQVNVAGAELLVDVVRRYLGVGGSVLWDLYCGAGLLGLANADRFERVIGIESVEPAVVDARANAEFNGIVNATFVAGPVEKLVGTLVTPDAVIVDPPRGGLHPDALKVIAGLAASAGTPGQPDARVLVYVACKPTSLLRDGKLLRAAGWVCTDRLAVDLFPQTAHIEVVTRWVAQRAGHLSPGQGGAPPLDAGSPG